MNTRSSIYSAISFLLLFNFLAATVLWSADESVENGPNTAEAGGSAENADSAIEAQAKGRSAADKVSQDIVETCQTVRIGDEEISYTTITGRIELKDEDTKAGEGEVKASVFYVAYIRNDTREDPASRPVTFSFNGGPGSSSVWMHLGLLGPRRVLFNDDGSPLPPPARLVDNTFSLLDVTDLVFIDPVSTGFSRARAGEDPKQFHGVSEDIQSVGEFIRLYISRNGRWSSPKFLIGESYGTTRAAGLSEYVQRRFGMYLNGVMLLSSALDFQGFVTDRNNDLPSVLFLPSIAATSWYHQLLDKKYQKMDLTDLLQEVEVFAMEEYSLSLMQGASLGQQKRQEIVKQLHEYTGLSEAFIKQWNLQINPHAYRMEMLRDQGRVIGRFDSRSWGYMDPQDEPSLMLDPSYSQIYGSYSTAFNDYVRRELNYENDMNYEVLKSVFPWNPGEYKGRYLNILDKLREALHYNPHMKIHVSSGYFDLATPYLATDYAINHLGIDPDLYKNITIDYYEAGHMMYLHMPSLQKQSQDLREFIQAGSVQEH